MIELPESLIHAELEGTLPCGTTWATLVFMTLQTTKTTARETQTKYNLPLDASKSAWGLYSTKEIMTQDGECIRLGAESPAKSSPVPSAQPISESTNNSDFNLSVLSLFNQYFPTFPAPTDEQLSAMKARSRGNFDWIRVMMESFDHDLNNGKEIRNPITLTLWKLEHSSFAKDEQELAIRKQTSSGDSLVRRLQRQAERDIANMPAPTATDANLERMKKLKEALGGR